MISYRFVPISSQKGVHFFETPGIYLAILEFLKIFDFENTENNPRDVDQIF